MDTKITQKIYYIKEVETIIGRNRLTLRRWWIKGKFPTPKLINNRLAWHIDTINNWIENNK